MVIFISPRARTPGWSSSSCRIPHILFMTGTSASRPNAMPPTAPRAFLMVYGNIAKIRQQLRAHQFQLRPDAAGLDAGRVPEAYRAIVDADKESQERFSGHGSRHRAGLQSHDPAAWQLAATNTPRLPGVSAISNFASDANRKGCGCQKRRSTWRLWTCWQSCGIQFTILSPFQASVPETCGTRLAGRQRRAHRSDPCLSGEACRRGNALRCSSMMARFRRRSPSNSLLDRAKALPIGSCRAFSDAARLAAVGSHRDRWRSYGHHHQHGDMALAYALHHIERTISRS